MTLLRTTAIFAVLACPALAADPELTVFDWAGFEEPALFQGYIDKNGDSPTFALYGDDDEAFQKIATGFKASAQQQSSMDFSRKDLFASTTPEPAAPSIPQQSMPPVSFSTSSNNGRFADEDYIPDFLKRQR